MTLTNASRRTTLWGTALIALVGLIHLLVVPEYFEFATYLGLLFIVNAAFLEIVLLRPGEKIFS